MNPPMPSETGCGVLLVTHAKLGHRLIETMRDMLPSLSLSVDVLEVRRVQDTDVLLRQGRRMIERLDRGAGVLLLTDAHGSTPANIACRLGRTPGTVVVAGVNLPMLVKVFNYPGLALPALAEAAVDGGRRGVSICEPAPE